jgi:hypothetical protein
MKADRSERGQPKPAAEGARAQADKIGEGPPNGALLQYLSKRERSKRPLFVAFADPPAYAPLFAHSCHSRLRQYQDVAFADRRSVQPRAPQKKRHCLAGRTMMFYLCSHRRERARRIPDRLDAASPAAPRGTDARAAGIAGRRPERLEALRRRARGVRRGARFQRRPCATNCQGVVSRNAVIASEAWRSRETKGADDLLDRHAASRLAMTQHTTIQSGCRLEWAWRLPSPGNSGASP